MNSTPMPLLARRLIMAGAFRQWRTTARTVWVPEGDHELRFRYDAAPFRRGLWLTGLTLAGMLFLLLWWNGHPQKRDPDLVEAAT